MILLWICPFWNIPILKKAKYSQRQKTLGYEADSYDDVSLDSVILAPNDLIRITPQELVQYKTELTASFESAGIIGEKLLTEYAHFSDPEEQLVERVERNYAEYSMALLGFGKRELIDMARKIGAMRDAREYMTTSCGYSDEELDFYLKLENPLEVVADTWLERNCDIDDMTFTMDYINEHRDSLLEAYPLMSEIDANAGSFAEHRYMGVSLYDFLGKIAEQTIVHYPNDWNINKDELLKAALSDNPEDKRLVWHVCSTGAHLKNERDVFVKDSGAYQYMSDYHQNDPDMFGYIVEITEKKGQTVMGNVFDVGNYADYAGYSRDTALPLDSVTLTYSDAPGVNAGKTVTVPRREYDDFSCRHRLMSESGNVTAVRFNPASEANLTELLRREHTRRMICPIGSAEKHFGDICAKLAEIRRSPDIPPEPPKQTAPKRKRSIADRLAEAGAEAEAYNAQKAQNPQNQLKSKKEELSQ
jgi:hypothetical protein